MRLVLLPGFMGDPSDWLPTITVLKKLGFKDISILPAPYQEFPSAEPFVLCGYSMGGRVAISLANSVGCRGVISISSSPGIREEVERRDRADADERLARRIELIAEPAEFRAFLKQWWSQPVFGGSSLHPDERERLIASRLQMDPRELASHLREFGPAAMPSLWNQWSALLIPKLAIAGERDPKYVALAREMGECRIISGAGHQVPMEKSTDLAKAIADFLTAWE